MSEKYAPFKVKPTLLYDKDTYEIVAGEAYTNEDEKYFIRFNDNFIVFWVLANKPKCNDESVKSVLKEILDSDEWIYVEYGLNEQSLRALLMSFKGMGFRELGRIGHRYSWGFKTLF